MKDINIDELLEETIKSQVKGEVIPVKYPNETKVLITGTDKSHLVGYIGTEAKSTGIQQNYDNVQKTKVKLYDGETAYFRNQDLKEKVDDQL